MISVFSIFNELFVLFIIILIGFIAKRSKVFRKNIDNALSQLLFYITLPALIIFAFDVTMSIYIVEDFLWLLLLSTFILGVAIVISLLLVKSSKLATSRKGVYQGLIIFGNQGFIGLALCYLLFQEQGIIYATIFNISYLLLIWTYGIYIVAKGKVKLHFSKLYFNPGIIATILGLLLLFTPLTLPSALSSTFEMLGLATIPLAMLFIGSLLAKVSWTHIKCYLKHYHLWLVVLLKLLILPLLLFPFMLLPVPYEILMIAIILTATPSAPTIAIYAKKYRGDTRFASIGVFITTVLALITIPFLFWLASYLFCLL